MPAYETLPNQVLGLSPQVWSRLQWGEGLSFLGGGSGSCPGLRPLLMGRLHGGEGPQGLCVLAGGMGMTARLPLLLTCCPPLSTAECSAGLCFNGGSGVPGSTQPCHCPQGFQGPHYQYGECSPLQAWAALTASRVPSVSRKVLLFPELCSAGEDVARAMERGPQARGSVPCARNIQLPSLSQASSRFRARAPLWAGQRRPHPDAGWGPGQDGGPSCHASLLLGICHYGHRWA